MKFIFITNLFLFFALVFISCGDDFKRVDTIMGYTRVSVGAGKSSEQIKAEQNEMSRKMDLLGSIRNSFRDSFSEWNPTLSAPTFKIYVFAKKVGAEFPEYATILTGGGATATATFTLSNGTYNFSAVGYDGGTGSEPTGVPRCDLASSQSLTGSSFAVNLTPTQAICNTSNFDPTGFGFASMTMNVAYCTEAFPGTPSGTCTPANAGNGGSLGTVASMYMELTAEGAGSSDGLKSACSTFPSGVATSSVNMPLTDKVLIKFMFFSDGACSTAVTGLGFPFGLAAADGSNATKVRNFSGSQVGTSTKALWGSNTVQIYIR